MGEVAALYVDARGVYANLPDVDVWGIERDARKYAGPWPVVAHPPCSRWCKPLALVNQTRYGHRIGDDGGCFSSALSAICAHGGVLEHPAESYAWDRFALSKPPRRGWQYDHETKGWVCQVSQSAYGHRARKRTWLLYVGPPPPPLRWAEPEPTATTSWLPNTTVPRQRLSKREASATPIAFRDMLLSLARLAGEGRRVA
jgi:hypothetical protein